MKRKKKPTNFHKTPGSDKIIVDTGPSVKATIKDAPPMANRNIRASSTKLPKKK